MALKLRLVDADVLDPDAERIASGLDNPVDHQEGIAVRQIFQQLQNIE